MDVHATVMVLRRLRPKPKNLASGDVYRARFGNSRCFSCLGSRSGPSTEEYDSDLHFVVTGLALLFSV
ncbi:hypothetical protein VNO77_24776 [Canavalia gladiata]|uniref:Uncharacterized protein n=1 Tax=Canavalia gladiata TaxID=3824 RepID=A0AAN9L6Y5_CANGL